MVFFGFVFCYILRTLSVSSTCEFEFSFCICFLLNAFLLCNEIWYRLLQCNHLIKVFTLLICIKKIGKREKTARGNISNKTLENYNLPVFLIYNFCFKYTFLLYISFWINTIAPIHFGSFRFYNFFIVGIRFWFSLFFYISYRIVHLMQ